MSFSFFPFYVLLYSHYNLCEAEPTLTHMSITKLHQEGLVSEEKINLKLCLSCKYKVYVSTKYLLNNI